ncbi:MAG: N-acetyl-gamma-glutamyl-phosphate reductase [Lachnospiraceae bacterium]
MIKVGIIGATGYAGAELVRILLGHPEVTIQWYGSKSYVNEAFADVYRSFFKIVEDTCLEDDLSALSREVDVIFTATPQGYLASLLTEDILSHAKVIDLSADYRIKDVEEYEKWYGIKHATPQFVPEAVYGLPEKNRASIAQARLIANPGCYPTCSYLTVSPLLRQGLLDPASIIIDAKSGVSGAGRSAKTDNLYCEINDSIKAYGVATHRHTPEIEEQLSLTAKERVYINFTPHLIPMNRGILVTAYASLTQKVTQQELKEVYEKCYRDEPFVRVLPQDTPPQTRWVKGSNYTDVNVKLDERTNRVIMMGALDNVVKGAAGQAVQNMNLMFGLDETTGLRLVPVFL